MKRIKIPLTLYLIPVGCTGRARRDQLAIAETGDFVTDEDEDDEDEEEDCALSLPSSPLL